MKTSRFFPSSIMMASLLLAGFLTFNSCKDDDDPAPTIKDVINTEAAAEMKATVTAATSVAALPTEVKADATAVTALVSEAKAEAIAEVNLTPVVATMKADNGLSSDEVNKLKANDIVTYNTVVTRLSKLPSFISQADIEKVIAGMEADPSLKDNLIEVVGSADNMYSDDFYAGAMALIKYRNDYTIPLLEKLNALNTSLKSASTVQGTLELPLEQQILVGLILRAIANEHRMSQAYSRFLQRYHSGGSAR